MFKINILYKLDILKVLGLHIFIFEYEKDFLIKVGSSSTVY